MTDSTSTQRNYRQDYKRRIERGLARGLSLSQARGHAKPGEILINPKRAKSDSAPLEAALKSLHQTGTLDRAARAHHVAPDRLKRHLMGRSLATRVGRKWVITDARPREMTVFSEGRARKLLLPDFENASLNGRHRAAVKQFLKDQDVGHLTPFKGQFVLDVKGEKHFLETDPNQLYIINIPGGGVYEQVYRLIY